MARACVPRGESSSAAEEAESSLDRESLRAWAAGCKECCAANEEPKPCTCMLSSSSASSSMPSAVSGSTSFLTRSPTRGGECRNVRRDCSVAREAVGSCTPRRDAEGRNDVEERREERSGERDGEGDGERDANFCSSPLASSAAEGAAAAAAATLMPDRAGMPIGEGERERELRRLVRLTLEELTR